MNFTTHELVLLSHGLQSRIEYWDKFESDSKLMLIRPLQELNERIEAEIAQREAAEAAADYQKFLAHNQPISDELRSKLAWASVDWVAVAAQTLAEDEKCVYENPAYLSIPF